MLINKGKPRGNNMKRTLKNSWEYLTEIANSDEGMSIKNASIFHSYNPNGLLSKLPKHDDFICNEDSSKINSWAYFSTKYNNYYAKEIVKNCSRRCSKISHAILLESIKADITESWDVIKERNCKGAA
jgi:hypothetical protein